MGCDLPCWWGLTPGISSWNDLDALFRSIGGIGLPLRNSQAITRLDFTVGIAPRPNPQPAHFAVFEQYGLIKQLDVRLQLHNPTCSSCPGLDEAARAYSLANVLATVGPPTEILLSLPSAQAEPGAGWTYGLWLYYEEKGIAAYYEGTGLAWEGDQIRVCPRYDDVFIIDLWLRDPSDGLSLQEITVDAAAIASQLASGELATIEQVSSLNPQSFYQLLQAPDACFLSSPTR
jgi:hypothetical protein